MILDHIRLRNFRTYDNLDLNLSPGLNLVLGENAAGKTNLVEAIQYLSLARSWRTSDDGTLVKEGKHLALIDASISEGDIKRRIEIQIDKNSKRIAINGKNVSRLSDLSKTVNVISFSPSDVALFSESPSKRRSFLDIAISKQSGDYFNLICRYNKLLKDRNSLLKQERVDKNLLQVITDQMIETSYPITRYRMMYVASSNEIMPNLLHQLRGDSKASRLVYRPFVKPDGQFIENARKAFEISLENDLSHRFTGVGPHREDFSFSFDGKDIASYGSQGENRMAVLALKLVPYLLIESEDKKPICVLDDVTSELDENRINRLIGVVKGFKQVFITATNLNIEGASVIEVAANNATRR
ncbi:MAG TPA: hypothetical protein DEF61_00375 [Firmicutes bacterium]|nr:hypothetical protein [Bacillota bacterium]HBM70832.1 hypothetical protein [Bacillota bacterium]HBX24749.1 hypothetical protein [Bacillota bacterium]